MGKVKIIGSKIKSLRLEKNISLKELADEANLSEDQLTAVEQNSASVSLASLIKIARSLGVRSNVFIDDQAVSGPIISRKCSIDEKSQLVDTSRKSMSYFSLAGNKSGRQMEPFIINLAPCVEKDFIFSSHQGEEFLFVLEGAVEINYGDDVIILEEGDSIFYDSIVSHHVHGGCLKGAKILAVVYSPVQ